MTITFPGESTQYRQARDRLLERELDLRRAMEDVAEARRALPPGGQVPEDYVFTGVGGLKVRLSELFALGKDSLVVYSFMFPREAGDDRAGPAHGHCAHLQLAHSPCPSCTGMLDQLNGAAEHVEAHVNLVVVAKAPIDLVAGFAQDRGWHRLRLLSSEANTYNRDYHGETDDGDQRPMVNVFHRDGDVIRHFWGTEMLYEPAEPGQDPRHLGTIEPLWNIFDLTPEGRGADWDEQIAYS